MEIYLDKYIQEPASRLDRERMFLETGGKMYHKQNDQKFINLSIYYKG